MAVGSENNTSNFENRESAELDEVILIESHDCGYQNDEAEDLEKSKKQVKSALKKKEENLCTLQRSTSLKKVAFNIKSKKNSEEKVLGVSLEKVRQGIARNLEWNFAREEDAQQD